MNKEQKNLREMMHELNSETERLMIKGIAATGGVMDMFKDMPDEGAIWLKDVINLTRDFETFMEKAAEVEDDNNKMIRELKDELEEVKKHEVYIEKMLEEFIEDSKKKAKKETKTE